MGPAGDSTSVLVYDSTLGSLGITASTVLVTGSILPSVDSTYDLGAPSSQWRSLYVAFSTIYIGRAKITSDSAGNIFTTNASNVNVAVGTKINILTVTGTSLTPSTSPAITASKYGYYYNITNSRFNTLTLPTSSASTDSGSFWVLRNATQSYLNITVTYTGTTGDGSASSGVVTIPPANSLTIAFTSSGSGSGAYTFF